MASTRTRDHRALRSARERFASGERPAPPVRDEILDSWLRSRSSGVVPDRGDVPFDEDELPRESRLCRAATPVLDRLAQRLEGMPAAVLLSDAGARVVRRWTGDRDAAKSMDRVFAAPGFVFAEDLVGTNGIGTPLEAGRPVAVVGCEHYVEALDPAACVGAPVRHPVSGRVEGVVNLTTRTRDASPLQLALVQEVAFEIEQELLARASARERLLLDAFATARHRSRHPVVCISEDMILTTPAAARLLEPVDQGLLWERAASALAGGEAAIEVPTGAGARLHARCRAVLEGDEPLGALLALEHPGEGARRPAPRPVASGLVGASPAWTAALEAVAEAAAARTPMLVTGEPGVGKASAIRAAAARLALGALAELDAGTESLDGTRGWLRAAGERLGGGALLLRHVDDLSAEAARGLAALVESAPAGAAWIAATAGPRGRLAAPAWRRLHDRLAVREVEVPPLRMRPEDVPELARALLRRHARAPFRQALRPDAAQLLQRLRWPGNVRELERALRAASAQRHAGDIRVEDLPPDVLAEAARRPLTPLERVELEAIVEALDAAGQNKRQAARRLGIARSTLYRKLRAYGLDLDRAAY
jgi:sigma-54 dependent transcriptional regulator, acetoin dehydrogenase operon transcriptional activator AcoR